MSEVSSWSNTDAGNNLTPPDGWPEGMQPSGVNDCGRMMMGAIKRWYDTVTAGIANALPLSGGTLTGPLTVPGLTSTGNITASGDLGVRAITASGNITTSTDIHGQNLFAVAGVGAAYVQATGDITANGKVSGGTVFSFGNVDASTTMGAPTIVAGSQLTSNDTATVTNALTAGSINTSGALSAGSISTSTLTATSLVNTVTYRLSGTNFATTRTDVAGTCNAIFDGGGGLGIDLYGVNGTYYRCDNAHSFTNRAATVNIVRFQVTDGVCQNATGSWSTFSDRALKENLTDYTAGLSAVLQLSPKSFNYIAGKNPFDVGGGTYYGLVAQDVEPILPEMVSHDDDGTALLQPTHLVFVLLNAVKELEARLAQLENRGG
jgi:hypothetical protein